MGQLDGKVAIVTGSGRGIGREVALRVARDGANVVVNDLDDEPARETIALIEKLGRKAVACVGNVTATDFGDRIVDTAVKQLGGVHVIVNNAGYTWDNVIQKMTDEQWYTIIDVHVTAPFRILRAFANYVRPVVEAETKAGQRVVRKIVNVSSTSGTNGNAGQVNYSAGKAAVVGLTKTLAKEWGQFKINVNAVAFGFVETRLTASKEEGGKFQRGDQEIQLGIPDQMRQMASMLIPIGRPATPEEAAGGVFFLCSPWSNYVHGQVLNVTGGQFSGMTT